MEAVEAEGRRRDEGGGGGKPKLRDAGDRGETTEGSRDGTTEGAAGGPSDTLVTQSRPSRRAEPATEYRRVIWHMICRIRSLRCAAKSVVEEEDTDKKSRPRLSVDGVGTTTCGLVRLVIGLCGIRELLTKEAVCPRSPYTGCGF